MKNLAKKYPLIVIWHKQTGSFEYYINVMLKKADQINAPKNTIYFDGHGKPVTINNCENTDIMKRIINELIK